MNESFSEELKKELVKQAVKSLDDPFKMLTVKDVAKDLYMGENKTNEVTFLRLVKHCLYQYFNTLFHF